MYGETMGRGRRAVGRDAGEEVGWDSDSDSDSEVGAFDWGSDWIWGEGDCFGIPCIADFCSEVDAIGCWLCCGAVELLDVSDSSGGGLG